jgi:hypothetical protein
MLEGLPTFVQWIEDYVTACRVVKSLHELACGVIHDGGISPAPDLPEYLKKHRGLTGPGVADDLHVLCFGLRGNPNHLLHAITFEADAITFDRPIELLRRKPFRAFQSPSVLERFLALHVLGDGERQEYQKEARATK